MLYVTSGQKVVDEKDIVNTEGKHKAQMARLPRYGNTETSITVHKEIPLNREFGHFIGMYIGDGWCDKNSNGIYIASIDERIKDFFIKCVNTYLRDSHVNGYKKANTEHEFEGYTSVHGKACMYINNGIRDAMINTFGHGAGNKRLPQEMLNGNKEFKYGLLSGLLDADGSVSYRDVLKKGKMQQNKNVMYSTISPELAINIQDICLSLGIYTSITTTNRKGTVEYTLVMSTVGIYALRNEIQTIGENSDKIHKFTFGSQVCATDLVPYSPKFHKHVMKHYSFKGNKTISNANINGYITRGTLYKLFTHEQIQPLRDEFDIDNNMFDKVVYCKKGIPINISPAIKGMIILEANNATKKGK